MFAKGGPSWFVPPLVTGALATAVGAYWDWNALIVAGLVALVVGLFLTNFFRDPDRVIGSGVVSAADGKVMLVDTVDDPDLGHCQRIAVFMSPLDVHVNRAPAGGTVVSVTHRPGGFLPAFRKESERNERVEVLWETEWGPLKTIQIAGTVARRIVPYVGGGEDIAKGDRYGLIRLSSRVDHLLPPSLVPTVRVGDRVLAGTSTIADSTAP